MQTTYLRKDSCLTYRNSKDEPLQISKQSSQQKKRKGGGGGAKDLNTLPKSIQMEITENGVIAAIQMKTPMSSHRTPLTRIQPKRTGEGERDPTTKCKAGCGMTGSLLHRGWERKMIELTLENS